MMCENPGGIGNYSNKTVLGTLQLMKIKSKETPKQGITVVSSTTNNSICSHNSSITYEIASVMLKISDLSKTSKTMH